LLITLDNNIDTKDNLLLRSLFIIAPSKDNINIDKATISNLFRKDY